MKVTHIPGNTHPSHNHLDTCTSIRTVHTCSHTVNQHFSFRVCCLSLRKVSLTHLHCGAPEAGALARRGDSFQGQCGITGCFQFLRSYPSSEDFHSHVWCGFLTTPRPPSPCRLRLTLTVRANALWFPALRPSQAECFYLPFPRSQEKVIPHGPGKLCSLMAEGKWFFGGIARL